MNPGLSPAVPLRWLLLLAGPVFFFTATPAARAAAPRPPAQLSVSEGLYDPETKILTIALRCVPEHLEAALARQAGQPVALADTPAVTAALLAYLQQTWRAKTAGGQAQTLAWSGLDLSPRKEAWIFFDVPLPGGVKGATFDCTFLRDVCPDQVNTLRLRDGSARFTLVFEPGETAAQTAR